MLSRISKITSIGVITYVVATGQIANSDNTPITSRQADEIISELRLIRQVLEGKAGGAGGAITASRTVPVGPVQIDVADAPYLGAADAPLAIVEFTDFQCPFCQRYHLETFRRIKAEYIDSGQVIYYSIDLPLDIHPNALLAAQAGRCANEQGRFWSMHDQMQENPTQLDLNSLIAYAKGFDLDVSTFRDCVEDGRYRDDVRRRAQDAVGKGARGTPAFVIGRRTSAGVEGEMFVGAMPYAAFDQRLTELKKNPKKPR